MEENTSNIQNEQIENKKSSNFAILGGIAAVAILVIGGIILFSKNKTNKQLSPQVAGLSTSDSFSTETTESPEPTSISENSEGEVNIVKVEAGSYYYKPNVITVKKGEKVKIEMTAADMMHDFNIDELGVRIPITRAGSTTSVEFTADKVGEFEFYCSVSNHRRMGQVGKLIVTE